MLRITGKIFSIEKREVVMAENDKFNVVDLVLTKQMNKKVRSIHFQIMGKLINQINNFTNGDRITVWFYIDGKKNSRGWFNIFKVTELEKVEPPKKENFNNQQVFNNQLNFNEDGEWR